MNIVDVLNPNSDSEFSQVSCSMKEHVTHTENWIQLDMASYISSVSVSPTGLFMAFGDADGAIHLLTAGGDDEPGP